MSSYYKRLATDVDDTEEAELHRLEGGAAAGTCRRQRNTGAAAHETGACTAGTALPLLVALPLLAVVLKALLSLMLPATLCGQ